LLLVSSLHGLLKAGGLLLSVLLTKLALWLKSCRLRLHGRIVLLHCLNAVLLLKPLVDALRLICSLLWLHWLELLLLWHLVLRLIAGKLRLQWRWSK